MEVPDSPVLSCKKAVKRHGDLTSSPILSCKRAARCVSDSPASPVLSSNKRKKLHHPDESPVFSRSKRSQRVDNEASSPEIDHFSSPARRANLARDQQGLRPKSLFPEIEATGSQDSGSSTSSQQSMCRVIEDSLSEEEATEDNPNILEKTFSDEEIHVSVATVKSHQSLDKPLAYSFHYMQRSSSSNSSLSVTQGSSFLTLHCTPPKKPQKKTSSLSACSGSSRKKNLLLA